MNPDRLRKAWACKVVWLNHPEPAIYFAPTAGKARYQCYLSARDAYPNVDLTDIKVARAADRDVVLPAPHWLLDHLTAEQRHIILHSFGGDRLRAGYRRYFFANCSNTVLHRLSFEFGLFEPYTEQHNGIYFGLTELGAAVAQSMVSTYPAVN